MQRRENNIVNKVIAENASRYEAREVVEWFSDSIEGQQHLSDMIDRDAYLMEGDPHTGQSFTPLQSDLLFSRIERNIRLNQIRKLSLRVAAVLLPLLLIAGFSWYINSRTSLFEGTSYTELYIPKGEDARIFFQDGTEVFLNADTRIRYPERFGLLRREVWLDGEAYFNVKENKRRPFEVHSQNTTVEVLGTSFNVNSYRENDKIRVTLDEGSIAFRTQHNGYTLSPGQLAEYDKITGQLVVTNLMHPSNLSLWKNNVLYFYDSPLSEVITVLERRFNVEFNLLTPEALAYSYTLTTRHQSLDSVLLEMQKIAPVRFTVRENGIDVSISTAM
jgi:ferric-dicitrate binding protein FerR (iron transport regulator)